MPRPPKKKKASSAPPDPAPEPTPPTQPEPGGPAIPSEKTLDDEINKQQAKNKGGRPKKPTQQEVAFQQEMEMMVRVLSRATVGALNSGFERLDRAYKPVFDLLEKQDGLRESFVLGEGEQDLLTLTTSVGMARMSPEFLAKYGFPLLLVGTIASIGFPRFMLFLRVDKAVKDLQKAEAKRQEDAQRSELGAGGRGGLHGERQNDAGETLDPSVVGAGAENIPI